MVRPQSHGEYFLIPKQFILKPRSIPLSVLEEVELGIDEMEVLRLCDFWAENKRGLLKE